MNTAARLSLLVIIVLLMLSFSLAFAQENSQDQQPETKQRKEMQAVRIANGSINLDGSLNEKVWLEAKFVSDFLQVIPVEYGEPTNRTEVAIIYDDDAIYIGARMYADKPENLRMDLSRRDDRGLGEQIIITLDTYLDRRTSYGFGVTTAGVRFDRYNSNDSQRWDFSWDAVWEVRTSVDDQSWLAEFKIPFSQLRFNNIAEQTWGININRWIPAATEDIFWVPIMPSETGWASRFGNLTGIKNIKPSRRLELMPYVASDGRFSSDAISGNPFDDGSSLQGRVGGDLKMGLGPNLTLDATFNPDFGQVEADPAVVNLSAYETRFDEKRPFFTEGSDLFSANGPQYFYSRRIGARPRGEVSGDYIDYPGNSTILGAAKITGRLQSGTSLGVLLAVTDSEYAKYHDTAIVDPMQPALSGETKVKPTTTQAVVRVKQDLGNGGSTAGMILTGLTRNMNETAPLAQLLTKEAISGALDYDLKFKDRMYSMYGHVGFSHVKGNESAILKIQQASAHYFQRPDASHVTLDSSRTSLSGYTASFGIEKNGGDHWLWEVGGSMESPGFELNDVGILYGADDIDSWAWIEYRETRPGKHFRNYRFGVEGYTGWNFGGVRQVSEIEAGFVGQWLNYWTTELSFSYNIGGLDDAMTRGGPLAGGLDSWSTSFFVSNNWSAVTTYSMNSWYSHNELSGYGWGLSGSLASRIGDRIKLSVSTSYESRESKRQYIGTDEDAVTNQTDYIFSNLRQSELSMQLRGSYFFSPLLSLELYSQPFASSGHYHDYGRLREPGSKYLDPPALGSPTRTDYGNRSFRSSMVLRWEFSPGSTAYFVWQRSMNDNVEPGQLVRAGSLLDGFSGDGLDIIAVKLSYWLPVS